MKILILGSGQVGSAIALELANMPQNDVTVVDTDEEALKDIGSRTEVQTVTGNGASPVVLERAGAADTDMLLALTRSDETNLAACNLAAELFNIPSRIARVRSADYLDYPAGQPEHPDGLPASLTAFKVSDSIHPEQLVTEHLVGLLNYVRALQVLPFAHDRVRMEVASGQPSGKIVAELHNVSKAFGGPPVVQGFSATLLRGDKVGLIGPNGAGKSTLLKLILGQLAPDSGRVRQGASLQVAYFDQMRAQLNPDATLEDFISPGSEWIEIGQRRQHVKSYLGDFLFSPARAASPVRSLSGGEQARLLLARLFARPANVLVLDEPTNDLDIDTLELLEELLQTYDGTVFLVSHDRAFMDNVVTSTIAWEGGGQWREYEGGITDWLQQSERARAWLAPEAAAPAPASKTSKAPRPAAPPAPATAQTAAKPAVKRKLSYKEQRELDALPARIDALEAEQAAIRAQLADGTLYQSDLPKAIALQARDSAIEEELLHALERWEALGA